jgi:hypothetical protein
MHARDECDLGARVARHLVNVGQNRPAHEVHNAVLHRLARHVDEEHVDARLRRSNHIPVGVCVCVCVWGGGVICEQGSGACTKENGDAIILSYENLHAR